MGDLVRDLRTEARKAAEMALNAESRTDSGEHSSERQANAIRGVGLAILDLADAIRSHR